MDDDDKDPSVEGREAALNDLETGDFTDCPYAVGTRSATEWHAAYNQIINS
jgi:hypothetical protein